MNIIRTYLPDEFNKIPKKDLIDFIGANENNAVGRILIGNRKDQEILKSWEQHFKSVKVPYAIEQRGKVLYLWKERRT